MRLTVPLATGLIGIVLLASCASDGGPPASSSPSTSAAGGAQAPPSPAATAPAERATTASVAGAPVPGGATQSAEFDAGRLNETAGRFPPLNDPTIVSAAEATWLDDGTLILGAVQNGQARAYPIAMMTFHHVANDVLGGEPYLVTF